MSTGLATNLNPEVFRQAKALYEESPSHVPLLEIPAVGTYCLVTALDRAASLDPTFQANYLRLLGYVCGESCVNYNATHTTEECAEILDICASMCEPSQEIKTEERELVAA